MRPRKPNPTRIDARLSVAALSTRHVFDQQLLPAIAMVGGRTRTRNGLLVLVLD